MARARPAPEAREAILVLQGGGALGAYECGVYKALVPHMAARGQRLRAVAGTSIGAINACLIALHYQDTDHGSAALERFWQRELSAPSVPFVPLAGFDRFNAVWTNLLFGHPRLYSPRVPGWNFTAPFFWAILTSFYDTEPMRETLHRLFGTLEMYQGTHPQLIVTAVDLQAGEPAVFDSARTGVSALQVMASCALPPWLPQQSLSGRSYWDGGLWSNTPLREALNALQEQGALRAPEEICDVYIADVFPREAPIPRTNWELWNRVNQVSFADKSKFDEKVADLMSRYIDFVLEIERHAQELPAASPLRQRIDKERKSLASSHRVRLNVTRIARQSDPGDAQSREIDFSSARIAQLIERGCIDARAALEERRSMDAVADWTAHATAAAPAYAGAK